MLSGEAGSKRRLEEANRVIREQSQRGVGPSFPPPQQPAAVAVPPPPHPTPPIHPTDPRLAAAAAGTPATEEPTAKRQRVEGVQDPRLAPPKPVENAAPPAPEAGMPPADPMAEPASPAETVEKELVPEDEFIKTLSKPEVTLKIRIPNDPTQMAWNFYGQMLVITIDVKSKVKEVKQELSKTHLNGMPANKIQLKGASGFLKDSQTLASLNIGPTATLEMTPKTRGGRR